MGIHIFTKFKIEIEYTRVLKKKNEKKTNIGNSANKNRFIDLEKIFLKMCNRALYEQYAFSSESSEFRWLFPWKHRIVGVDARKFGNEYVSDLVTLGYVQSVCKTGKGQGVKRKRDRIDKPPCQSKLRSSETRDTFNVTFASVESKRNDILWNTKS